MRYEAGLALSVRASRVGQRFLPPNSGIDLTTSQAFYGEWQEFLFAGHGAARVRTIDTSNGFIFRTGAPDNIVSFRLIIDGVAVPEPTAVVLAFTLTTCDGFIAGRRPKRRGGNVVCKAHFFSKVTVAEAKLSDISAACMQARPPDRE
jgi:hypothetical protein